MNVYAYHFNCLLQLFNLGFAISGTSAPVIFELFVKGSKTKASYAGPTGEGPVVGLDTCANHVTDGDETDEDCGGLCSGCGPNAKCKASSDCSGGIPCVDNVCGLDGKTQGTAAKTCKAIKKQFKDAKVICLLIYIYTAEMLIYI